MGVIPLPFELKKFARVSTLMARWECSVDLVRELASKGVIKLWHPEGKEGTRGLRVDVASVLEAENKGYISCSVLIEED